LSHSVRGIRKKMVASIALAGLTSSGLAALNINPAGATQTVTQDRVAGLTRYGTATAISAAGRAGSLYTAPVNDIVLASGESFPDGLAGAALAGSVNSPLLLTAKGSLPAETVNELAQLAGSGAKRVHVMGGEAAVSADVRTQLTSLGYTVVSNYSGTNRYDTAAKIAAAVKATNSGVIGSFGGKSTAIVATGEGFADALAASAPAARGKHPILLTSKAALNTETSAALTSLGVQQVILMGGEAAVSAAVETALKTQLGAANVIRVAGADRAATAVALANIITTTSNGFGFTKTGVVLFNGFDSFADGLAAGPHAAKIGAVLLPVQKDAIPAAVAAFHTSNAATLSLVRVIGGTSAVSATVADGAKAAATIASPTATIATVQAVGATITFSEAIDPTTLTAADLVAFGPGGVKAIGAITANATNTVFSVAIPTLAAGDTVGVVDLLQAGGSAGDGLADIATPAPARFVKVPASVVVVADTVAPTVSAVIAKANGTGGNGSVTVVFSEPVVGFDAAADLTLSAGLTAGAITTVSSSTYSVAITGVVASTSTVRVNSGTGITDAALNAFAGFGPVSFALDAVVPVAQSAKLGSSNSTANALANTGGANNVVITAKAAGSAGNGVVLNINAGASVSAGAVGNVITVTTIATTTIADIAAAINGNAAASALATATTTGVATTVLTTGTATTAGGTTTQTITIQYSEAMASQTGLVLLGGFGTLFSATLSDLTAGKAVYTVAPPGATPLAVGASISINAAALDLVGNASAASILPLT
jgi:putative cell wall-binding protein